MPFKRRRQRGPGSGRTSLAWNTRTARTHRMVCTLSHSEYSSLSAASPVLRASPPQTIPFTGRSRYGERGSVEARFGLTQDAAWTSYTFQRKHNRRRSRTSAPQKTCHFVRSHSSNQEPCRHTRSQQTPRRRATCLDCMALGWPTTSGVGTVCAIPPSFAYASQA